MDDDPAEEALSRFLMENGLDDPKWVSKFREHNIVKPDETYQYMDQEELYKSLSSGASSQEQAALRKILKITEHPENLGEDIKMKLHNFRLEPSYWSTVFEKQLGVTSTYSVEHVGSESYTTLKQFARKPWERKALRDLLKMEDAAEDSTFQKQREKQREKLKSRQVESKQMLQQLKRLQKNGKNGNDEEVKYIESSICEVLQISQELWLSNATLNDRIHKLEAYHDRIDRVLMTRERSEVSVIQNASNCLALQGILLTKQLNDQLQVRGILLKAPKDIHLVEPFHFQHIKVKQFASKQQEDMFTKTVDRLGYSVAASAKVGFWEFNLETYSTNIQTTEEQISSEHNERETYSTLLCHWHHATSVTVSSNSPIMQQNTSKRLRNWLMQVTHHCKVSVKNSSASLDHMQTKDHFTLEVNTNGKATAEVSNYQIKPQYKIFNVNSLICR